MQQQRHFDWSTISEEQNLSKRSLEKYREENQNYVYSEMGQLWTYVKNNARKLNDSDESLSDYEQEELLEIRATYPELKEMDDCSLFTCHLDYQRSFNLVNGYDIYREEAFVFYLICNLAQMDFEDPVDIFIGEIIANFLLQYQAMEKAKKLATEIKEIYREYQVYWYRESVIDS